MHTMMERTELKELFEAQADWRTQKAAGHPDDVRNAKAAEILNRLAATVDRVPPKLMAEYSAVFVRWDTSEVVRLHDDALRAIGFHTLPETATDFVQAFIELANADRRRFETPAIRKAWMRRFWNRKQ
jgi:hypothetical protein